MTPQEYCAALEQALSPMPPEERQETIRYYLEFLEEASEEERAALGTPQELAAQLLRDSGIFPRRIFRRLPPNHPAEPASSSHCSAPFPFGCRCCWCGTFCC